MMDIKLVRSKLAEMEAIQAMLESLQAKAISVRVCDGVGVVDCPVDVSDLDVELEGRLTQKLADLKSELQVLVA